MASRHRSGSIAAAAGCTSHNQQTCCHRSSRRSTIAGRDRCTRHNITELEGTSPRTQCTFGGPYHLVKLSRSSIATSLVRPDAKRLCHCPPQSLGGDSRRPKPFRNEISPNNIILIGPTGVARQRSHADSPSSLVRRSSGRGVEVHRGGLRRARRSKALSAISWTRHRDGAPGSAE